MKEVDFSVQHRTALTKLALIYVVGPERVTYFLQ